MTGPQPSVACERCGAEHAKGEGVSFGGRPYCSAEWPYCSAECAWSDVSDSRDTAGAPVADETASPEADQESPAPPVSPVEMQTMLWAEQAEHLLSASQRDDVCGGAPSADAVAIAAAIMVQPHCAVIASSVSVAAGPMHWSMP